MIKIFKWHDESDNLLYYSIRISLRPARDIRYAHSKSQPWDKKLLPEIHRSFKNYVHESFPCRVLFGDVMLSKSNELWTPEWWAFMGPHLELVFTPDEYLLFRIQGATIGGVEISGAVLPIFVYINSSNDIRIAGSLIDKL